MKNLCKVLIFICIFLVVNPSIAEEIRGSYSQIQADEQRINVSYKELFFTERGIFLIRNNEALPLTAIFVDSEGLYVLAPQKIDKIWNTCDNGHTIYHQECGGCANWLCTFRCKCYSPWSSISTN